MIPMNHEERIPMKYIKTFLTKALMLCVSVFSVVVLLALLTTIISFSFYSVILAAAVSALIYMYLKLPSNTDQ